MVNPLSAAFGRTPIRDYTAFRGRDAL